VHACACRDSSSVEVAASSPVKISGYQVSSIRIIDPLLRGVLPSPHPSPCPAGGSSAGALSENSCLAAVLRPLGGDKRKISTDVGGRGGGGGREYEDSWVSGHARDASRAFRRGAFDKKTDETEDRGSVRQRLTGISRIWGFRCAIAIAKSFEIKETHVRACQAAVRTVREPSLRPHSAFSKALAVAA